MSMMIDRQIRQAPIINPCQCNIKTEKYNFTTLIQVLCLNLPCFLFSHMRCTLSCSRGDGPLSKHVQPSFMLSFPCVIWYCKLLLMIRKKKKERRSLCCSKGSCARYYEMDQEIERKYSKLQRNFMLVQDLANVKCCLSFSPPRP